MYPEFIRSGGIVPLRGRTVQLSANTDAFGIFNPEAVKKEGTVKALSRPPWDVYAPNVSALHTLLRMHYEFPYP